MRIHFHTGSGEEAGFNFFTKANRNMTDRVLGPSGLLAFFELHFGLTAKHYAQPYRMIAFRNRLCEIITEQHPFYKSFSGNEFAVCMDLLRLYDELIMLEWKGESSAETPRLQLLSETMNVLKQFPGESDRWITVGEHLSSHPFPAGVVDEILVYDSEEWIHPFFRKFFNILHLPEVKYVKASTGADTGNNLEILKRKFLHRDFSSFSLKPAREDHSVLILKSDNVSLLADLVNAIDRKDCILVDGGQAGIIDASASRVKLPLSGLYSGSLNNPFNMLPFQLINLLREAPDALTLISFLQNTNSPVSKALRVPLLRLLKTKPGFDPGYWKNELVMVSGEDDKKFLIDHEKYQSTDNEIIDEIDLWFSGSNKSKIRDNQYWFEKHQIQELFRKASNRLHEGTNMNEAGVFLEQINAVLGNFMAEEISEQQLYLFFSGFLKPAGSAVLQAETGYIPCAGSASSVISPFNTVIWWNLSDDPGIRDYSGLYSVEKEFLEGKTLWSKEFERSITEKWYFQSARPILNCSQHLILMTSEMINGQKTERHPFLDFLDGSMENPDVLVLEPEKDQEGFFQVLAVLIPDLIIQEPVSRNLPAALDHWQITPGLASLSQTESFSSLESLVYYPHEYVFGRIAKINDQSPPDPDATMLNSGNCSHRIFELLFKKQGILRVNDDELTEMIDELSSQVIREQFIALNSPEFQLQKKVFLIKMHKAVKVLFHHLRTGKFTEAFPEENFKKDRAVQFGNISLTGKIDLHLKTAVGQRAIIDFKWTGTTKRRSMLKDEKDMQLCLYSYLLTSSPDVPAAFFIIDRAQLISYRNDLFPEARIIPTARISWEILLEMANKIRKAYELRKAEIEGGYVEVGLETDYETLAQNSAVWSKSPEGADFPKAYTSEGGMQKKKPVNKNSNYNVFSPVK